MANNQRIKIKEQQRNQKKQRRIMQVRQCFVTTIQNWFTKGSPLIKHSQLVTIIKKLEAVIEAADNEVQIRRFEREGVEKCIVSSDKSIETFGLTESDMHRNCQFNNIGTVAMEIYDLIQ